MFFLVVFYLLLLGVLVVVFCCFFFQAEDGIRDLVRSRGLGDVYKRQAVLFEESLQCPTSLFVYNHQWLYPGSRMLSVCVLTGLRQHGFLR